MSRTAGFVVWLGIMLTILAGTHYYLWARLVRDVGLGPEWRRLATALLFTCALSVPAAFVVGRDAVASIVSRSAVLFAFVWIGAFFLLLVLLGSADLMRFIAATTARLHADNLVADPERRLFVARLIGGGAFTGMLGLTAWGVRNGLNPPQVVRVDVSLRKLPAALDGLRVVQISDLHVSSVLGRDYVEEVVARANALQPDIIAITGDLVDGSVDSLREAVAPLAKLSARLGVFFVTGNHEYYSGVESWLAHLPRLGMRVLRNERITVGADPDSPEDSGRGIDIAGVDDWSARRYHPTHGSNTARALSGRNANRPVILLAHQPRAIHEAAEHEVDLMLSGHTHGGQIWPFVYLVRLVQPYVAGLDTHENGPTQIYVSRGTGHWGPPMRVGAPSELTLLTLRAAATETSV